MIYLDSSTSDLVTKRSASPSKSPANNSSVSSPSSTDSTSYKSESTKKHKKKQKLNQPPPESRTTPSFDSVTGTKSNSNTTTTTTATTATSSNKSNPAVEFEESDTATVSKKKQQQATLSGVGSGSARRRQSNDSSSQSSRLLRGRRHDSSVSQEALSTTEVDLADNEAADADEEVSLELGEREHQDRLRRPSSSSAKSTSKVGSDSFLEVPHKRQKLNAKSNLPTTSKSSDTSDKKRSK